VLGVIVGLTIVAAPASASEEEARVLILNGTDPYLPAYLAIDGAMRASLAAEAAQRIIYFSESLDAQRVPIESVEPELLALLAKKYSALHVDVVIAASQPALEFFRQHGERLWPHARLVFSGWPGEAFDPAGLPPDTTAAVATSGIGETIDLSRRLQPNARRILVISGASDLDKRNQGIARQQLSKHVDNIPVEFLSGLPLPELVARVAAAPADTIVLYIAQFRDRDGRPYTPREVARAISIRSVAPIYGTVETYLGFGMVAGMAESYEEHGRLIGQLVGEALAGVKRAPDRALVNLTNRCVADARALERWSLDAARLPDGCEIRFADQPVWRHYGWQIAVTLMFIAAQAMLITRLLVLSRRRRMAEAESRKRLSEMAHMNRRVAMGELSASLAHELNQPLGAIRNNVGAAEMLIKADPPRLQEVAEILGDIKRDDQRASEIITRMRTMLRKTEFKAQAIDLNEVLRETVKMMAADASAKGVSLKSELETGLPKVSADQIQLQQVAMNLMLNAIEALLDQPAEKRKLVIRTRRTLGGEAEVSVADSGRGIPLHMLQGIFDPFVTSKATGMGLGLAISRTIIEAHGGQIRAENVPAGGAVISFTLPFAAALKR
jgi:signal transduction histidine kinase